MSYTEAHYVTQNGAGTKTGRTLENAWDLTAFQNSANWSTYNSVDGKIGPGDVVYFSGTFTSRIVVLRGGNTNGFVTLDGYEAGETDPVNTVNTGTALLSQGIDIGNSTIGPDYLAIQDFRMTRDNSSNACFQIYGKLLGTDDEKYCDHLHIRRNYVYETNGTLFYIYNSRSTIIEDNKFFVFGQNGTDATQGVNFINLRNSLVRRNELGHNETLYPSGCSSANMLEIHASKNLLFEYNNSYGAPNQSSCEIKESAAGNNDTIIVRFNKIHSNMGTSSGRGMQMSTRSTQPIQNFYVYGNYIFNNYNNGVQVGQAVTNVYFWSNIVSNNGRSGIVTWANSGETVSTNLNFINNTFSRNGYRGETNILRGGMSLSSGSNINIKNNLFWNNRHLGEGSRSQIASTVSIASLEHNKYYHSLGDPYFYYNGAYRTLAYMQGLGFESAAPAGSIVDPKFISPSGDDGTYGTSDDNYRLSHESTLIDAGKTVTGSFSVDISGGDTWFETETGYSTLSIGYDDALDPILTDWTT